jgi:hypothetical protein
MPAGAYLSDVPSPQARTGDILSAAMEEYNQALSTARMTLQDRAERRRLKAEMDARKAELDAKRDIANHALQDRQHKMDLEATFKQNGINATNALNKQLGGILGGGDNTPGAQPAATPTPNATQPAPGSSIPAMPPTGGPSAPGYGFGPENDMAGSGVGTPPLAPPAAVAPQSLGMTPGAGRSPDYQLGPLAPPDIAARQVTMRPMPTPPVPAPAPRAQAPQDAATPTDTGMPLVDTAVDTAREAYNFAAPAGQFVSEGVQGVAQGLNDMTHYAATGEARPGPLFGTSEPTLPGLPGPAQDAGVAGPVGMPPSPAPPTPAPTRPAPAPGTAGVIMGTPELMKAEFPNAPAYRPGGRLGPPTPAAGAGVQGNPDARVTALDKTIQAIESSGIPLNAAQRQAYMRLVKARGDAADASFALRADTLINPFRQQLQQQSVAAHSGESSMDMAVRLGDIVNQAREAADNLNPVGQNQTRRMDHALAGLESRANTMLQARAAQEEKDARAAVAAAHTEEETRRANAHLAEVKAENAQRQENFNTNLQLHLEDRQNRQRDAQARATDTATAQDTASSMLDPGTLQGLPDALRKPPANRQGAAQWLNGLIAHLNGGNAEAKKRAKELERLRYQILKSWNVLVGPHPDEQGGDEGGGGTPPGTTSGPDAARATAAAS